MKKKKSIKNNMNKAEWKQWVHNLFKFSRPTLVLAVLALYNATLGGEMFPTKATWLLVVGSVYQALLASLLDLNDKYRKENFK